MPPPFLFKRKFKWKFSDIGNSKRAAGCGGKRVRRKRNKGSGREEELGKDAGKISQGRMGFFTQGRKVPRIYFASLQPSWIMSWLSFLWCCYCRRYSCFYCQCGDNSHRQSGWFFLVDCITSWCTRNTIIGICIFQFWSIQLVFLSTAFRFSFFVGFAEPKVTLDVTHQELQNSQHAPVETKICSTHFT